MSKNRKLWLGVLTFLPLLGIALYIIGFFVVFIGISEMQQTENPVDFLGTWVGGFGLLFTSLFVAIISSIGVMIYYIIHAVNNKSFSENERLIWILVLVLANGLGNFIYYFVVILPLPATKEQVTQ